MDKYTHKNQKKNNQRKSDCTISLSTQKSVNPQKDTLSYLKQ